MQESPRVKQLSVKAPDGKIYEFDYQGFATPDQLEEVRKALEAAGAFLERLSQGVKSEAGNEEPLKIRFLSYATREEDLKPLGMSDDEIQRCFAKLTGFYRDNTIWLKNSYFAGFMGGMQPAPLADTARHEIGHAIDDFLVQKTQVGFETGRLTIELSDELTAHRIELLESAGLTQKDIDHYRELKKKTDNIPWQEIRLLEEKIEKTFPSAYGAAGPWDAETFSLPQALSELWAESWNHYSNPEKNTLLLAKDPQLAAGLATLETALAKGTDLAEAIRGLRAKLKKA